MATFPGGSAYAMVRDIADGHVLMTERHLQRMAAPDLEQLRFELDRHMREIRGDQPSLEDLPAVQNRNRRIQRINTALMVLRSYKMKRRM
ncbi:MAG TPA: hypothetical protein VHQ65_00540 [Thermoanaerobaculia bacterium]|nr:hypothetical protein [Thermoanaerobaculia bacterium]